MGYIVRSLCFWIFLFLQATGFSALQVGIGRSEITPPIGTPSAGYTERKGEAMTGVHDPLLASALFIDNGDKKIFFCSVDHLGFPLDMTKEICSQVQELPELSESEIYITSSHTHSGGGSYLNVPSLGNALCGPYNPQITQWYVQQTTQALISAYENRTPAKIGIGYGKADSLQKYRGLWPQNIIPPSDVSVIKITSLDDKPLAVLFNFAIHPTVLTAQNRLFSADFVGYTRTHLKSFLGLDLEPLFVNGAQGDILPVIFDPEDRFASCDILGKELAKTVRTIWEETQTYDSLHIITEKLSYTFVPEPTPFGVVYPIGVYPTEMNILVLNHTHAFLTIPGELSCVYDHLFQHLGQKWGFSHVSIFGLCNDAHGYIISPESWHHKTYESRLSFGGENYGEIVSEKAQLLLHNHAPIKE